MTYEELKDHDSSTSNMFKLIYEKYKKLVYYIILQIINIPSIAEELTNDTFLILYQHWNKISNKTGIKQYLAKTAKRLAYTNVDKYREENSNIDFSIDINQIKGDYINSYEHNWDFLLEKFDGYLNATELDLMIKVLYFEYKGSEIARESGESIFTIESRIRRLKIKLRKFYKKESKKKMEYQR